MSKTITTNYDLLKKLMFGWGFILHEKESMFVGYKNNGCYDTELKIPVQLLYSDVRKFIYILKENGYYFMEDFNPLTIINFLEGDCK